MKLFRTMMVCTIAIAFAAGGCKKEKFTSRDRSKIVAPPVIEEPEEPVDPSIVLFASADDAAGWQTVGEPKIETAGKKEGTGYLKNSITNGNDFMQFIYKPATPVDTKLTATNGQFVFWWYLSDPTLLKADGQIEVNSVGDFDKQEYGWSIAALKSTLKPGWNEIKLNFKNADKTGGDFDPSSVKQFRIFFFTESKDHAELVSGVDGLMFRIAPPASPVLFDGADDPAGWQTVGEPKIETSGKKEGTGYLKNSITNGNDFMQFIKNVDPPFNTTFTKNSGVFTFWWFVSDPTLLKADGQIEINSVGDFDKKELNWPIAAIKPTLKPGWNELKLKLSEAEVVEGDTDLAALKQFRIFFFTESKDHAELVTGIDGLRFIEAE